MREIAIKQRIGNMRCSEHEIRRYGGGQEGDAIVLKVLMLVLRRTSMVLLVSLFSSTAVALAQPQTAQTISDADWDARRKLIDAAEAAHKAGDHAKALELGQRAGALQMSPAVRFFISQEQEETGALIEAFAGAQRCAREASLDPSVAPAQRELLMGRCRDMQTRLRARVAHIVIRANEVPEGLSVKLSGQTLNRAAIGIPYLVQPGRILVEAVAPGYLPYHLDITVSEGQTINVTLQMTPTSGNGAARVAQGCPVGQSATADGRCISDACRVGMVRAPDGVHCCWPGQSFGRDGETCKGTPACPAPLEARGEGCYDRAVVRATAPGEKAADATNDLSLQADAHPAAPPANLRRWGTGLLIGGAAALVAGGGFWLLSDSHFRSVRDACAHASGCAPDTYNDGHDNVKRYDRLAVAGLITGSVLALAGATLFYMTSTEGAVTKQAATRKTRPARQVAWDIDPIGRSALVRVGF